MSVRLQAIETPRDDENLVTFLCSDEWPFHGRKRLTPDDVAAMDFATADVASFWIIERGPTVGLVRALDLGDISNGAPLLDIRIASPYRRQGYGTVATTWIVDYLFTTYPELHRIEANTRHDNIAMQRVLAKVGFALEGRLRESWSSDDGERFDTLLYGLLRTDLS